MKACYIDVTSSQVKDVVDKIAQSNPDRVLVLAPTFARNSYSPTKRNKNHRITIEVAIPEDGIVSPSALFDFGILAVIALPKKIINPKFLAKQKEE